ncbi:TRAP-type C4-dicarboxylate transport system permease small subunit [Rhodoligotrophos appendicifer]|uniref:TRAP transporter small permease n=1 Tax=Rhodoligotrophos appendicifer TaxID=987056 RepID=UPI0011817558|nr:TRAP transporter small permease [Rhodoligotrophos appendicifer]
MRLGSLSRFNRFVVRPAGIVGALALLILAAVIFVAVIARQLGISIIGADEIAQLLLVFMVFLSMTVTQSQGGHIRMEAVVSMLPPRGRRVADLVSLLACISLSVLILYGTSLQAWSAYEGGEYQYGTMSFPLWPAKTAVAFGILLFTIYQVLELIERSRPAQGETGPKPNQQDH